MTEEVLIYDFSKGEPGESSEKAVKLNIPIYLEPDVRDYIKKIASKKGMDMGTVVNKLIREIMPLGE